MNWSDRIRIFVVFLIGLIYAAFEIFEDLFNIALPFDEIMGLGVAAISYFLLIRTSQTSPWQAWLIAGLWIVANLFDWIAPDGTLWDEGVTLLVLIAVFTVLFWPLLKRLRVATN
jgi:inner membrane protein involved in colicin E2 resistance